MENFFSRLALSPQRTYWLGRHFLFWFLCWMFMGFIYGFYYSGESQATRFVISYIESLIYLPQHMVLSYGIIYFVLPRCIFKGRYWEGIASVFVLIVFVAVSSPVISKFIIIPLRQMSMTQYKSNAFLFSFMAGLRGSMTVAGFAVAIKLVKVWYNKKIDHERLEKEKVKAELQMLKGQLNPHFMFNTLNSIYSLALKKSDFTPAAILKLSQLMRYIITDCAALTVDLQKEIQVIYDYIGLEKMRFESRVDLHINIEGDLENKVIAPLLLLPYIENSFKHGVSEMIEQAWITLDLQVKRQVLKFRLINGKAPLVSSKNSHYLGLMNNKRRLELLYPEGHQITFTEDEHTFIVFLELELDKIKLPEV